MATLATSFQIALHDTLLGISTNTNPVTHHQCAILPSKDALGGEAFQIQVIDEEALLVVGVDAASMKEMIIAVKDTNTTALDSANDDFWRVTNLLLLGAPMNYAWWNMRKQALLESCVSDDKKGVEPLVKLNMVRYELHFTAIVLSKYPKLSDVWYHRQFILTKMIALLGPVNCCNQLLGHSNVAAFLETEWKLVAWCSEHHLRNYAAWQHCSWLCDNIVASNTDRDILFELALHHYEHLVSDPSSAQFIISALQRLVKRKEDLEHVEGWVRRLLQSSNRMLRMHAEKGHEGLWIVRRGVVTLERSLNTLDHSALGGWGLSDELEVATVHTDAPHDETQGLKSLADSSGSWTWHRYNATKYGLWLCDEAARVA